MFIAQAAFISNLTLWKNLKEIWMHQRFSAGQDKGLNAALCAIIQKSYGLPMGKVRRIPGRACTDKTVAAIKIASFGYAPAHRRKVAVIVPAQLLPLCQITTAIFTATDDAGSKQLLNSPADGHVRFSVTVT